MELELEGEVPAVSHARPPHARGIREKEGEERDEEQWTGQEVWEHHDAPLEHTAWEPDPLTPRRGGVANVSLHLPAFQDEIEHETCPNG